MTDRHAPIRAALDAGPKSGKWTWKQVGSFNTPGCAVLWPDTSKGGVHYRRIDSGGGMDQVDAEFIAACHPEAIRALLADHDTYRRQAQHETDVAHAAFERVKALEAERDAFADVLEAIASIKATPGRAKADALLASVVNLARAALAQGQEKT